MVNTKKLYTERILIDMEVDTLDIANQSLGTLRRAYRELLAKYKEVERNNTDLINQLSEKTQRVEKLETLIKKSNEGKGNTPTGECVRKHSERARNGNIRFKSDIDMKLLIKLYKQGNSAGKIFKVLEEKGVQITRQSIYNRLKQIGLWGNRQNWSMDTLTEEQREYIKRHNIEIL